MIKFTPSLLISVAMSIGAGVIAMYARETALATRVDQLERSIATEQHEMLSRNEFAQFTADFREQMRDVLSRLKEIDRKVGRGR